MGRSKADPQHGADWPRNRSARGILDPATLHLGGEINAAGWPIEFGNLHAGGIIG